VTPVLRFGHDTQKHSSAGQSACPVSVCRQGDPHTARAVLKGFFRRGQEALRPSRPGPAPDWERRQRVAGALARLLCRERTSTSRQLSAALGHTGLDLGPRQMPRYLKPMRAGYRRTVSAVTHKQDPAKVERTKAVLAGFKNSSQAG